MIANQTLKGDDDARNRSFWYCDLQAQALEQLNRADYRGKHYTGYGEPGAVNAERAVDAMLAGAGIFANYIFEHEIHTTGTLPRNPIYKLYLKATERPDQQQDVFELDDLEKRNFSIN